MHAGDDSLQTPDLWLWSIVLGLCLTGLLIYLLSRLTGIEKAFPETAEAALRRGLSALATISTPLPGDGQTDTDPLTIALSGPFLPGANRFARSPICFFHH